MISLEQHHQSFEDNHRLTGCRRLFRAALLAACDAACPAVQKEIDDLSAGFREGRQGLLTMLGNEATGRANHDFWDHLFNQWVWAKVETKRSTGRTRDEWLALSAGQP